MTGTDGRTQPVLETATPAVVSNEPVFEIEGLDIEYVTEQGRLHAVRGVSLQVHKHESLGIVGESGSGKSTLAMGAIGYLASNGRVTAGSARLNGVDLLTLPKRKLRELWGGRIAVVYQNPLGALNPSIQIGKQIAEVDEFRICTGKFPCVLGLGFAIEAIACDNQNGNFRRHTVFP